MNTSLKKQIYDVITGKGQVRHGAIIQTITRYLGDCAQTSREAESPKQVRKQETQKLEVWITNQNLWIDAIDLSKFVSEGAEQRVYLKDTSHVIKLNDGIYYQSWRDYFHSLLLHNFFFEDTAYRLTGFIKESDVLYAVVEQPYVSITSLTDLEQLKHFMGINGFENTRNNDYINPELGIILEDLHDENVLTRNDLFYFIDTVFYLTPDFYTS
jgi:hypothetical protein